MIQQVFAHCIRCTNHHLRDILRRQDNKERKDRAVKFIFLLITLFLPVRCIRSSTFMHKCQSLTKAHILNTGQLKVSSLLTA